jgi:hypothetical protein
MGIAARNYVDRIANCLYGVNMTVLSFPARRQIARSNLHRNQATTAEPETDTHSADR